MAIQIFCTDCKTSNGLDAKKCSKCGKAFGRDKKYRVSVSVKGVRRTRVVENLTIAREVEAAEKADIIREEFDVSHHKVKKVITLGGVWEKYLPWAKEHKKSWMTDEFYYCKHLKPRFGSKALDDISPMDIERMKLELKQSTTPQGKPYSSATIKHQLVLLNRLYNVAAEWGLYSGKNPMSNVKKPKLDNEVTEFLTADEMQRLLDTLDAWPCRKSAAFVKFGMFTGCRKGELFKLQWQDVDFSRKTVVLRDPEEGKTSDPIPLSDEALEVLNGLDRSSSHVFPGPKGQQKRTFRNPWYKIRKAAGLPAHIRFHGLRHNFASHLVSNGMDLLTVGKLLNHKTPSVTKRYAHLADERVREAAIISGKLLAPKQKPDNVVQMPVDRL